MTYQDPHNRRPARDDNYTGWIIGGVAAFALIMGLFFMFGRNDNVNTASDMNKPAVTAPTTTGSGSSSVPQRSDPVQPANPAGNMPTAPGSTR